MTIVLESINIIITERSTPVKDLSLKDLASVQSVRVIQIYEKSLSRYEDDHIDKQAGAELCQAQAQVGLPAEAELMLFSMEVPSIFSKLFKTPLE